MTEQEAIKEIRSCLGFNNIIEPYSNEMEAFGMAIQALEKQVPKKPIEKEHVMIEGYMIYKCSVCDKRVEFYNFCQNCGQKLDWSV